MSRSPEWGRATSRVQHLEAAFAQDIDHSHFIPYLSLHEFEALVLAAEPDDLVSAFPDSKLKEFVAALPTWGAPEEIDEGTDSHPSARLLGAVPGYRKRIDGPRITERIGLTRLRNRCPHFEEWVSRLEALTEDV